MKVAGIAHVVDEVRVVRVVAALRLEELFTRGEHDVDVSTERLFPTQEPLGRLLVSGKLGVLVDAIVQRESVRQAKRGGPVTRMVDPQDRVGNRPLFEVPTQEARAQIELAENSATRRGVELRDEA